MTNKCPHPKCQKLKPFNRYACYEHWMALPKPIQNKIWDSFRSDGALSPKWLEADKEAITYWGQQ